MSGLTETRVGATDAAADRAADDVVQPFQIEASSLRGRLVRLGGALDQILTAHDYPEPVARLLGETVIVAAILASALKYEGIFTLQTKGDGAVPMMVVDVTSEGVLRGFAQIDRARFDAAGGDAAEATVPALLGRGYLSFTVDQGDHTDRYQGIVELTGDTLADCVKHYFRQSEQIDAGIKVAVGRVGGGWRAGGLMVQRMPDAERAVLASDREDDWRRTMILMGSCTEDELLDPGLAPQGLLWRLFHEDGVRVFTPRVLHRGCRCSRGRVETILASLPQAEVMTYLVDGQVSMNCEFCNTTYYFDEAELARLYPAN